MALFGKKTEKTTAVATSGKVSNAVVARDISGIILRPVITEKAALVGDRNVYVFFIGPRATKIDVRDAVRKLWNVVPTRINIVNREPRTTMSRARGRRVTVPGMKKAYVYLKKGDTIDLV